MKKHEADESNRAQRKAHYQSADTNDKLIINLRDLSHTLRFLYEGRGSQKRILIVLNRVGTITQRALTERLGIQPGSASEVIAKLEGAGLITRTTSDTDRRTADIELTQKGKELAAQAVEQRNCRHREMFSGLSEDEKAQLLSLLEKVNCDWDLRYRNTQIKKEHSEHHHEHHSRIGGANRFE